MLPLEPAGMHSAWHLFVVRVPQREQVIKQLAERGIGTLIHYPVPPFLQPAYAELAIRAGAFPIAERLAANIPRSTLVETDDFAGAIGRFVDEL